MTFQNPTFFGKLTFVLYILLTTIWGVILFIALNNEFRAGFMVFIAIFWAIIVAGFFDYLKIENVNASRLKGAVMAPVMVSVLGAVAIVNVHLHEPFDTVGYIMAGFFAVHLLLALMVYLSKPSPQI